MSSFIQEYKTKSGERVYVCALCPEEKINEADAIYRDNFLKADFTNTRHDYYIDLFLLKIISMCSPDYIKAVGVGIIIKDAFNIGGGIIGSPKEEGESAEGKADYIGDGLYCCAFGGRFGAVYRADEKAEEIYNNICEFNKKDIKEAVFSTRDYLMDNTEEFLILADGSGEGAFPYCAAYTDNKLKEFME